MKKRQVDLLTRLVLTPSPTGYEKTLLNIVYKEFRKFLPKKQVWFDKKGNLIGLIKGTTHHKIIIGAHADEIGLIVTHIGKDGFIRVDSLGGVDRTLLLGRKVLIHSSTKNDIINGVIGKRAIHVINDIDNSIPDSFDDIYVDIGTRSRKEALRYTRIGDPITFVNQVTSLVNGLLVGHGFDDKAGIYILCELLRLLVQSKKKIKPNIYFVCTVQEEIGGLGAKSAAFNINPHLYICIDVTHATDFPEKDEFEHTTGLCKLRYGPVLFRGVGVNERVIKKLTSIARSNKIKVQFQALKGDVGYESDIVSSVKGGISTATIGIPLRYMHTPTEIVSVSDINNTVKLLYLLLTYKYLSDLL